MASTTTKAGARAEAATAATMGSAAPFAASMAAVASAAGERATDYKALVCLFMGGGNDYANTLTPYDAPSYAAYQRARAPIAHARAALDGTLLRPAQTLDGGRQYALAPSMSALMPLFQQGVMAPVLSVGTLFEPATKQQYLRNSVRLPPKLFSHSDQQGFWQTCAGDGVATGWGGRIGDVVLGGNGNAALTCINMAGNAVYLTGEAAAQYTLSAAGPVPLLGGSPSLYGSAAGAQALRQLMTATRPHLIQQEYSRIGRRALDTYGTLSSALAGVPGEGFPLLNAVNGSFSQQLRMVARMIAAAPALGQRRQVFMLSTGGYDTHDGLPTWHPGLVRDLADSMRAFYDTTAAMGVAERVTTFSASDFGRTLASNGDGSDHGWGSVHFVVGGAVKGGRYYGQPYETGVDTDSDVGQGRLLPTTSVDQYAATLAAWFGVPAGEMATVLPNLANYPAAARNLGFMAA